MNVALAKGVLTLQELWDHLDPYDSTALPRCRVGNFLDRQWTCDFTSRVQRRSSRVLRKPEGLIYHLMTRSTPNRGVNIVGLKYGDNV